MKKLSTLAVCFFCFLQIAAQSQEAKTIVQGNQQSTPKQPQAVIDSDGTVHLVYGDGENVMYCSSTDGGDTFTSPQKAFRVTNMSLGMRRGPRIALSKGSIIVTAIGGPQGKGKDGDLQAWNSNDRGKAWKGPIVINDEPNSAREGLHAMCSTQDGTLWNVWLDLRHKRTEIYASQSRDQGTTWQANQLLYQSPDRNVCECCHPSVFSHGNTVAVMFRNSLKGNRDMYLIQSTDSGKTFSKAKKLGVGEWQLNACPMDGGMVGIGWDQKTFTAWTRRGTVYLTDENNTNEMSLGSGNQPWIATTKHGPIVVWTNASERSLYIKNPDHDQPTKIAAQVTDPVIVSHPNGNGSACVFWESKEKESNAIKVLKLNASSSK